MSIEPRRARRRAQELGPSASDAKKGAGGMPNGLQSSNKHNHNINQSMISYNRMNTKIE